jgi:hypothetical protein
MSEYFPPQCLPTLVGSYLNCLTPFSFMGKNNGKGALGLWMHQLRSTTVIHNYTSSYYNGPAVKMGAGVRGQDALPVVHKAGLRIVAGSCPTVGLVGGFHQGGGHSSVTSTHGMVGIATQP